MTSPRKLEEPGSWVQKAGYPGSWHESHRKLGDIAARKLGYGLAPLESWKSRSVLPTESWRRTAIAPRKLPSWAAKAGFQLYAKINSFKWCILGPSWTKLESSGNLDYTFTQELPLIWGVCGFSHGKFWKFTNGEFWCIPEQNLIVKIQVILTISAPLAF